MTSTKTARSLTADELASKIYAERGKLIVGVPQECRVGQRVRPGSFPVSDFFRGLTTGLKVVAPSSAAEWEEQRALALQLLPSGEPTADVFAFYYCVEAAD